jgi:uncharacterized membrane protein HdeD (DUF308 family)
MMDINKTWYNTDRESFKHRPLTVTIVAILVVIIGLFSIGAGFFSLALAGIFSEFSVFLIGLGSILIAIGIAYLVVSYGLMIGKGWAWSITMILSYIGIVISIIAIVGGNFAPIVQLIISIAIIYFLYRPQSKAYFGKPPNAII